MRAQLKIKSQCIHEATPVVAIDGAPSGALIRLTNA
jgi:hypothetical protein